jgi:hypothetical protein
VSISGAQRGQHGGGVAGVADDRAVDRDHVAAAQRLRDPRDVRDLQEARGRRDGVGRRCSEGAPGLQDLPRALPTEDHHAGRDRRQRDQLELQSDDCRVGAAPAPQRPVEVGLAVAVRAHEPPVGGNDVEGQDPLAAQAVAAAEPPDAAADAVADHADARCRAGERGKAVLGCRSGDVRPDGAGLHAGDACLGVDLHAAHGGRADEDALRQVAHRRAVVAGALDEDAEVLLPGVQHDLADVLGGDRKGDHRRSQVVGQVPGPPRDVVVLVLGQGEVAPQAIAKGLGGEGVDEEHAANPPRRRRGAPTGSHPFPAWLTAPRPASKLQCA